LKNPKIFRSKVPGPENFGFEIFKTRIFSGRNFKIEKIFGR